MGLFDTLVLDINAYNNHHLYLQSPMLFCFCVSDAFLLLTVVDCGTLTNPINGQVSHTAGTTLGQTATYSCDVGNNLVGDSTRMCQATEVWSGSVPTCQGMLLLEL